MVNILVVRTIMTIKKKREIMERTIYELKRALLFVIGLSVFVWCLYSAPIADYYHNRIANNECPVFMDELP